MDALLETINVSTFELISLAVIGFILIIGLITARFMFKLTKTMLQGGCFLIVLIVIAMFFLTLLI